jgi:hypothetical protein
MRMRDVRRQENEAANALAKAMIGPMLKHVGPFIPVAALTTFMPRKRRRNNGIPTVEDLIAKRKAENGKR